jgi:hypothetical protein
VLYEPGGRRWIGRIGDISTSINLSSAATGWVSRGASISFGEEGGFESWEDSQEII